MEQYHAQCDVCGGRGFLPSGVVRRQERFAIELGRPMLRTQKSSVWQPCPQCRGTGTMRTVSSPRRVTGLFIALQRCNPFIK
jgi:RecJ-like exonuclease